MNEHDQRAQFREAPEPEEGNRATPKIVLAWIAILIVWGVGYYAWQIGKPLTGGDSRTPVASAQQESAPSEPDSTSDTMGSPAPEASEPESTEASGTPESSAAAESGKQNDASQEQGSGEPAKATASAAKPDGEALFSTHCTACHQASGQGVPGAFPPLAGSEWVQADAAIPVAIVHDGLQGKIEVAGNSFQGAMPAFGGQLSNAELAAVLSYSRNQWGNSAGEIGEDAVASHEERFGDRKEWTAEELTEVFGEP